MKKSVTLVLVAVLALGMGIAYAAPMLIVPMDVQLYPQVLEGVKAEFSVDIVYANIDITDGQISNPIYDMNGNLIETSISPTTNVTYDIVLNVTNLSDQPATLYEVTFAAGQDVTVQQSILGGTIYDYGINYENSLASYKHFGGIVDGVYLDGQWTNITWIPKSYYDINGTQIQNEYPACLFAITQTSWEGAIMSGPLNPDEVQNFSSNHTIGSTIPELPENATEIGIWFEGVPIAEYYDQTGNPLVTMMYINGGWVDVTGRVTVDETQPMTTVSNMLVNEVMTFSAQPYKNMNSTIGPVTSLPTWGSWGVGGTVFWFPWDWSSQEFNSTFAPHESRLIAFNHTNPFTKSTAESPPDNGIAALQTGNLDLYASVSNYVTNWPVNGTYYDTVSTTTQVKQIQFETTPNSYLYNNILADNQTFQRGNSDFEVIVASRIDP
jgi:hypothetical protein